MKNKFLLLCCSNLFFYAFAVAQSNPALMLDSSFGKHGQVITKKVAPGRYNLSAIKGMVLQADGSIIAAGSAKQKDSTDEDITIVHYMPDGKLDLSFGNAGVVYIDYSNNSFDAIQDLKKQSTGKMIALCVTALDNNYVFINLLSRFNTDGSVDASFGNNGWLVLPNDVGSIAIDNNDNIIACGELENTGRDTLTLRRYSSNGVPDLTFGKNGLATADTKRTQYVGISPVIAIDGLSRIVAGFTAVVTEAAIDDFVIVRFKSNGTIDSSFNGTGMATVNYQNKQDYLMAITIQQNNKILAGGGTSYPDDFLLARLNENGKPDKTFGNNGIVIEDFTGNYNHEPSDYIVGIAVQSDKKIVAVGNSLNSLTGRFAISRYTADGKPDSSYGLNGKTRTTFEEGDTRTYCMLLQPDDRIVAGGYTRTDGNVSGSGVFAIARYLKERRLQAQFSSTDNLSINSLLNKPTVYPNPATDKIFLKGLQASSIKIIILDNAGNTVLSTTVNSNNNYQVNIASLKKGLYHIKIINNDIITNLNFIKG